MMSEDMERTPFDQAWARFRRAALGDTVKGALEATAKLRSVYRPAALRKRVRKLGSDALASAPTEMWIDVIDALSTADRAYALGRLRWEIDDVDGAIDAFRLATNLPAGEWALADSLLWAGYADEAEPLLRAIAGKSDRYEPFARVLLATELADSQAASTSVYEAAAEGAGDIFGEGPSQQNFKQAFQEHLRKSRRSN